MQTFLSFHYHTKHILMRDFVSLITRNKSPLSLLLQCKQVSHCIGDHLSLVSFLLHFLQFFHHVINYFLSADPTMATNWNFDLAIQNINYILVNSSSMRLNGTHICQQPKSFSRYHVQHGSQRKGQVLSLPHLSRILLN